MPTTLLRARRHTKSQRYVRYGTYHSIPWVFTEFGKHPAQVFGKVRYGLNILPNTPVRFGTRSIPVPDT